MDSEADRVKKEMTGVYISGHPLSEYSAQLANYTFNSSMFVQDAVDSVEDGDTAEIMGIIAAKQVKSTRSNDMMCFLTLEDLFGEVEVVVFPRQMKSAQELLDVDTIIAVKGRVSCREGEDAKIVTEKIMPVLAAENLEKIYLKIEKSIEGDILSNIKDILRAHEGKNPVYAYDEASGKKYRFDRELWVNIDSIIVSKLKNLLGEGNVVVKK